MIGQKEMLDIILTEEIQNPYYAKLPVVEEKDVPKLYYYLRLVKNEDGTYEWKDD